MNQEEWLKEFLHLNNNQIIDAHFSLQEQIKKHYKLRADPKHMKKAMSLCEQQIALSSLTLNAMKAKHNEDICEYKKIFGRPHPQKDFYIPSHYGYRQYAVILRKQKNFDKLEIIEAKRRKEGWK